MNGLLSIEYDHRIWWDFILDKLSIAEFAVTCKFQKAHTKENASRDEVYSGGVKNAICVRWRLS